MAGKPSAARNASASAEPTGPDMVTVDVLSPCSGEGWAAPKGLYRCPPDRAAMLIDRGYARAYAE